MALQLPEMAPLVTILIATKDRPDELRLTLEEMRRQEYAPVEMLVVDDASKLPVERGVQQVWPGATVIRHENSAGQCARRNEGFDRSKGEYILQLDDDCSFVRPDDLAFAIRTMQAHPEAGALAFYLVNSQKLPEVVDTSHLKSGCVAAFVGAAVLFRSAAIRETSGYRTFYANEWEEEELGLQLLSRGWQIVFVPQIVAHHRLSPLNRNSARTWMRGLRNRLWAIVIHFPVRRWPIEIGWKASVGGWDAIRLKRFGLFFQALFETVAALPGILRVRKPLSSEALRRYDALRLNPVLSPDAFQDPPAVTSKALQIFWQRWRNRARNRSVWDSASGDIGTSYTVAYAHEKRIEQSHRSAEVE